MKIYSTKEAAEQLGVGVRTIQRHCEANNIGTRFGRSIVLTDNDIATLRSIVVGRVGNPNFTPGNRFGKSPEE